MDPLMTEREQAMERELVEEEGRDRENEEPHDGFLHDGEADGDALASAGLGTDEDYREGMDIDCFDNGE